MSSWTGQKEEVSRDRSDKKGQPGQISLGRSAWEDRPEQFNREGQPRQVQPRQVCLEVGIDKPGQTSLEVSRDRPAWQVELDRFAWTDQPVKVSLVGLTRQARLGVSRDRSAW
jgi:hypothetical protein